MAYRFYEELLPGELPHPPISLPILLVVEEALRVTWERMRSRPRISFNLLTATEDVVTHELCERLSDEVYNKGIVSGFDRQLFTLPTRDAKVRNYNGTNLNKMPDLLVGFTDRLNVYKPSQDWLFIECKPVDYKHPVGTHYCDLGIIRFVRGEYAWAMTNALMIGYTRSGYTISPSLVNALKTRIKELHTIKLPCRCSRSKPGQYSEAVQLSQHTRTFNYVETGHQAPAITIRHLWLRRD
jgi:hypothetical protein